MQAIDPSSGQVVRAGRWLDVTIDRAQPARLPAQRVYLFPFDSHYVETLFLQSVWAGTCQSGFYKVPSGLALVVSGPSKEITGMFKEPFKVE